MNFTPKMESFCTFFFTPFLELNLLLENNSVRIIVCLIVMTRKCRMASLPVSVKAELFR